MSKEGASGGLGQILSAIHAVMKEVGYVSKSQRNDFHHYNYAGEADLLAVLRPALLKHGLVCIPSLDGDPTLDEHGNTHLVIEYTLAHVSGEVWPCPIRVPGCGNDKNSKGGVGDKGTYKALTGANKYFLFKLFQIETGDDPEKDTGSGDSAPSPPRKSKPAPRPPAASGPDETISEAQQKLCYARLSARMKSVGHETSRENIDAAKEMILAEFGWEGFSDVTKRGLNDVLKAIEGWE